MPGFIAPPGLEQQIIPASPTLISLLRAVAYGWRQELIARNAQEISALGRELYGRLGTMQGTSRRWGADRAVDGYTRAVGSLEVRLLVSARRFRDLGAVTEDIPELAPVEHATRALQPPVA